MHHQPPRSGKSEIQIYTFGKFLIIQGNDIVSDRSSRSKKVWELFKFMLSNRDQAYSPEAILGSISLEEDYSDPGRVMRGLMFRLKQTLGSGAGSRSLADNLEYKHGSYRWQDNEEYWLDVDDFEELAYRARTTPANQAEDAAALYQQAIDLYKGLYLPDSSYLEWVIPHRVYYYDLYLDCLISLTDLLKSKREYNSIIKLCEQALAVEYFEEKIHTRLIEALIAEGMNSRAKAHYNEVSSTFYRELGIKPSRELRNLYRLISSEEGGFELDLAAIQEGLKSKKETNGAYLCDPEFFRYLYNLERFRSERSGKTVLLGLITVAAPDYKPAPEYILKKVMHQLQETSLASLRKGDIVTRWNNAQLLMILPGLNREQAEVVMRRIENNYIKNYSLEGLKLHKKVDTLMPLDDDAHFF